MLEIRNICAGYSGKTVLQNVSMTVHAGTVTVLLGPNGCGKSTLLKALCGILPVRKGELMLDGGNLLNLPQTQLAQRISYLAQARQIPDITVRRMVLHGRYPYLSFPRQYRPQDYAAADAAMEQMDIQGLSDLPLQQLSGGQRQKVYIAMALAQDTPVLLLDEPTTYLDVSYQLQMMRHARTLASAGKHVLMVLHDLSHALQTADQAALLCEGRIVFQGTPEEVYSSQMLTRVFGVRVYRIDTDRGWKYYCEEDTL